MNQLVVTEACQGNSVRSLLAALGVLFVDGKFDRVLDGKAAGTALLLSEPELIRVCEAAQHRKLSSRGLLPGFSQVLVYPFSGTPEGLEALQRVVGCRVSAIPASANSNTDYRSEEHTSEFQSQSN